MNSLDTNILVYAANVDCDEHERANRLVNQALSSPHEWIIAEQVLFDEEFADNPDLAWQAFQDAMLVDLKFESR